MVVTTLVVAAFLITGSIYLILDMDVQFQGRYKFRPRPCGEPWSNYAAESQTVVASPVCSNPGIAADRHRPRLNSMLSPLEAFHVRHQVREIEQKYDYRYSQLILVFGRLVREGRIAEEQLRGLSEEKLSYIRRFVSL